MPIDLGTINASFKLSYESLSASISNVTRAVGAMAAQVEREMSGLTNATRSESAAAGAALEKVGSSGQKMGQDIARGAEHAQSSLGNFRRAMDSQLTTIAGQTVSIGTAFVGMAVAVEEALRRSVDAAASFDMKMQQVGNNTTMTDAEIGRMSRTVQDMAMSSGASMDQLADGFMHITNFGYHGAEAVQILDAAMKSAVSTGGDVGQTANVLATAMHEFGMSGADASRAMDILHVAATRGNMTLQQFVENGGQAIAAAANLGVTLPDVSAAMSALSQHGFDAAQASTQVKDILFHLISPAQGARDAIAALGRVTGKDLDEDFSTAGLKAKGLYGVLEDVRTVTGEFATQLTSKLHPGMAITREEAKGLGNIFKVDLRDSVKSGTLELGDYNAVMAEVRKKGEDLGASIMMGLIPAIRGGLGAVVLTKTAHEDYKNTLISLNNVTDKSGISASAFAKEQAKLGAEMARLHQRLEVATIQLGTQFTPAMKFAVGAVEEAVRMWGSLSTTQQTFIEDTTLVVGTILGLLGIFAKTMGLLESVSKGWALLTAAKVADTGASAANTAAQVTETEAVATSGTTAQITAEKLLALGTAETTVATEAGAAGTAVTASGGAMTGLAAAGGPIGVLIAAIAGLALAWQTDFGHIREITFQTLDAISERLEQFADKVRSNPELRMFLIGATGSDPVTDAENSASFLGGHYADEHRHGPKGTPDPLAKYSQAQLAGGVGPGLVPRGPGSDAIVKYSRIFGIDERAAAAVAAHESGLNPASEGDYGTFRNGRFKPEKPGTPGGRYTSFGLFQLHEGGLLGDMSPVDAKNPQVNASVFLREALKHGAGGKTGLDAIKALVATEAPANQQAEIADAWRIYQHGFGAQIHGGVAGGALPPGGKLGDYHAHQHTGDDKDDKEAARLLKERDSATGRIVQEYTAAFGSHFDQALLALRNRTKEMDELGVPSKYRMMEHQVGLKALADAQAQDAADAEKLSAAQQKISDAAQKITRNSQDLILSTEQTNAVTPEQVHAANLHKTKVESDRAINDARDAGASQRDLALLKMNYDAQVAAENRRYTAELAQLADQRIAKAKEEERKTVEASDAIIQRMAERMQREHDLKLAALQMTNRHAAALQEIDEEYEQNRLTDQDSAFAIRQKRLLDLYAAEEQEQRQHAQTMLDFQHDMGKLSDDDYRKALEDRLNILKDHDSQEYMELARHVKELQDAKTQENEKALTKETASEKKKLQPFENGAKVFVDEVLGGLDRGMQRIFHGGLGAQIANSLIHSLESVFSESLKSAIDRMAKQGALHNLFGGGGKPAQGKDPITPFLAAVKSLDDGSKGLQLGSTQTMKSALQTAISSISLAGSALANTAAAGATTGSAGALSGSAGALDSAAIALKSSAGGGGGGGGFLGLAGPWGMVAQIGLSVVGSALGGLLSGGGGQSGPPAPYYNSSASTPINVNIQTGDLHMTSHNDVQHLGRSIAWNVKQELATRLPH